MNQIHEKQILHACSYCKGICDLDTGLVRQLTTDEEKDVRLGALHLSHGACNACGDKVRADNGLPPKHKHGKEM